MSNWTFKKMYEHSADFSGEYIRMAGANLCQSYQRAKEFCGAERHSAINKTEEEFFYEVYASLESDELESWANRIPEFCECGTIPCQKCEDYDHWYAESLGIAAGIKAEYEKQSPKKREGRKVLLAIDENGFCCGRNWSVSIDGPIASVTIWDGMKRLTTFEAQIIFHKFVKDGYTIHSMIHEMIECNIPDDHWGVWNTYVKLEWPKSIYQNWEAMKIKSSESYFDSGFDEEKQIEYTVT